MKRIYYYHKTTDDVVDSHDQNFSLPDDYVILPNSRGAKIWSAIARPLAAGFGWLVFRFFDNVKVIGAEKLKQVDGGYFIYGNHTRPMGDVFTSLTIFPLRISTPSQVKPTGASPSSANTWYATVAFPLVKT